jgi:hypothetical protein
MGRHLLGQEGQGIKAWRTLGFGGVSGWAKPLPGAANSGFSSSFLSNSAKPLVDGMSIRLRG